MTSVSAFPNLQGNLPLGNHFEPRHQVLQPVDQTVWDGIVASDSPPHGVPHGALRGNRNPLVIC